MISVGYTVFFILYAILGRADWQADPGGAPLFGVIFGGMLQVFFWLLLAVLD